MLANPGQHLPSRDEYLGLIYYLYGLATARTYSSEELVYCLCESRIVIKTGL